MKAPAETHMRGVIFAIPATVETPPGKGLAAMTAAAALKLKETWHPHAGFGCSAEAMHGPVSMVDHGFPVLAFAAADQAGQAGASAANGAAAFALTDIAARCARLPVVRASLGK